jgi:hypothetical protein
VPDSGGFDPVSGFAVRRSIEFIEFVESVEFIEFTGSGDTRDIHRGDW